MWKSAFSFFFCMFKFHFLLGWMSFMRFYPFLFKLEKRFMFTKEKLLYFTLLSHHWLFLTKMMPTTTTFLLFTGKFNVLLHYLNSIRIYSLGTCVQNGCACVWIPLCAKRERLEKDGNLERQFVEIKKTKHWINFYFWFSKKKFQKCNAMRVNERA